MHSCSSSAAPCVWAARTGTTVITCTRTSATSASSTTTSAGRTRSAGYFDVEHSPLSPYSTNTGRAYLYGQLPLYATKLAATLLGRDSYGELYLVGRHVSAFVDLLSIVLVFLIGRELLAPRGRAPALFGALLASAFYALSVTAIQHAHFFTVESWLVFWTLLAFWLAALAATRRQLDGLRRYALMAGIGVAVGAAVSTKLSGALVLLPVAVALGARTLAEPGVRAAARLVRVAADGLIVLAAAYVALPSDLAVRVRALQLAGRVRESRLPDGARAAAGCDQRHVPLSARVPVAALDRASSTRRATCSSSGLGPALGIAAVVGVVLLAVLAVRRALAGGGLERIAGDRSVVLSTMLLLFAGATFGYFGTRFAHSLRYLVPAVPFLCLAAAAAVLSLRRFGRPVTLAAAAAVLVPTLAWALAFTHIYREPNTRVRATTGSTRTSPPGSVVVSEHWDDAASGRRRAGTLSPARAAGLRRRRRDQARQALHRAARRGRLLAQLAARVEDDRPPA